MVSSLSFKLAQNRLITGFGTHRKATTGRGYVRKGVCAVSRPAPTYIANKIADVISGNGRKRRSVRKPRTVRRTVHSAGSFRPSGYGVKRRRPRSTLTRKRRTTVGTGRKTRKPRATLARVRRLVF